MLSALASQFLAGMEPSGEAKSVTARIAGVAEDSAQKFSEHVGLMNFPALPDVLGSTNIVELRAALKVAQRLVELGIQLNRIQQASGSTALGAGLADIEQVDPVWEAIQALSLAALLRSIPTFLDSLTELEKHTEHALHELELAKSRRESASEPTR